MPADVAVTGPPGSLGFRRTAEGMNRRARAVPGRILAARQSWERLSDPRLRPQERLFFELYAHALRGRPGTEGFLDGIVESWAAPVAAALVKAGADERAARADARLVVAVVRGLLLDLLATGDRAGTTRHTSGSSPAPRPPPCQPREWLTPTATTFTTRNPASRACNTRSGSLPFAPPVWSSHAVTVQ